MTLWRFDLSWEIVDIANIIRDSLVKNGFTNANGKPLEDIEAGFNDKGQLGIHIQAWKKDYAVEVILKNSTKEMLLRGGLTGEVSPQYEKTFTDKELDKASEFFEEILSHSN